MRRLENLVSVAARKSPDQIAVVDDVGHWSYAALDAWSDRVAGHLTRIGVREGDRIALWAPKSFRMVALMQGALRIGAAYVPIDPDMPAARADQIAGDCSACLIVTTHPMSASLTSSRSQLLLDDDTEWMSLSDADTRERPRSAEHQLAYVLYTSGSTGRPKGVCISHRNALAFVEWAVRAVGVDRPAVFANHAAFSFDLSVFDLYGAFLTAGTVCLVPGAIRHVPSQLVEFLRRQEPSIVYAVPSVFVLMLEHGGLMANDKLEPNVAIFAGEPFPPRHLRTLRARWPRTRLFNFYGPTETNVCTAYELMDNPDDLVGPVPIGSAACGDEIWAVTADGTVARPGEVGELYVHGPTVMLGYWGAALHVGPYRTGDLCLRRADGLYEFVGRRDHMIKIRGHRVEPGEIEATLREHPDVSDAVVLAIGDGLDRRMVALIVPAGLRRVTLLELKSFCVTRLPAHMLIDRLEVVPQLPLTPNGKIDRLALAAFVESRFSTTQLPAEAATRAASSR